MVMASSSQDRGELSQSRGNSGFSKKDIFLSHSGQQKDFVENLYHALERAGRKAFMDKHSLPKASRFPPDIWRAAEDCKLGVVVLSDDFINSKWPMLELAMLFEKGKKILPLFYKLRSGDLQRDEKLSQWQQKWEELVNEREVDAGTVKDWERLVKKLRSINGIVFIQQGGENAYIEMVVTEICKLVPCQVPYDLSSIYGHEELAKEIGARFDAGSCEEARMVGLCGVGGQGKTTLCMTMVNFYSSQYNGRCCLIEFPTDGNKVEVLRVCKRALRILANLSGDVLEDIGSFEQVIQQIKDRVREHDVFLAIDNVWSNSEVEAEALLSVGFTAASKILLTSQSGNILRNLLGGRTNKNRYIGSLPAPKREVAFQIFEKNLRLGGDIRPVKDQIYNLLEKCRFDGGYHPLALKALAQHVKKSLGGSLHHLQRCLEESNKICLEKVEDAIKLNYDVLLPELQYMFLDIILWLECRSSFKFFVNYSRELINPFRWLWHLYGYPETKINRLICGLAESGLIQTEADEVGLKMIRVHDLYLQLAESKTTMDPRFLKSTKAVDEGLEWEKLERVRIQMLEDAEHHQFIEKLRKHKCPKVKLLYAADLKVGKMIHMQSLPSLRVLMLRQLRHRTASSAAISPFDLSGCPQLEFVFLEDLMVKRVDGLDALLNLQILVIGSCPYLKNLDGLRCLTKLEILNVQSCSALMTLPDLGGGALSEVTISSWWVLKKLADLSGAAGLQRLNASLEEGGAALKELHVVECGALKKLPDLGGATGLERLKLCDNGSLEEVVGFASAALKELEVAGCGALKKLPDLGGATGLERLVLSGNDSLEEVVGCLSAALKELEVEGCGALKKSPDLGGATSLERLKLWDNGSLEEVVGSLSAALKELQVRGCGALKRLPDLGGATGLERVELWDNGSLEEVEGCLSAALKTVSVGWCRALKKLPDLGGATGLEILALVDNGSLEEVVGCLSPALKRLTVGECRALKRLPDLGGATALERVELFSNGSLEDVFWKNAPVYVSKQTTNFAEDK